MSLSSIAYSSRAAPCLTDDSLDALVRDATRRNRLAGVTGILLYDGTRFLEYLEGPEEGINLVLARAERSAWHSGGIRLGQGEFVNRKFPYWSMHRIPAEQHELHAAAIADWTMLKEHRSEIGMPTVE